METKNIQTTFDLTQFINLNAPKYNRYAFENTRFPELDGVYGNVFYMEFEGKITALKFLAWARTINTIYYLVQTPLFTQWITLNNVAIFTSVSDLVSGVNRFEIPKEWEYNIFFDYPNLKNTKIINQGNHSQRLWEVRQSYYYDKSNGGVAETNTRIAYLVGTPQGIFFGLEQKDNCKNTPQEVLAERFDGMEIVDFAEPIVVEIKIEIPSTEVVTRKLVLE